MENLINNITVTSDTTLSNSFMGDTMQICVVTHDIYETMKNFVLLGIGPWRVYTFDKKTVSNLTYKGRSANSKVRLALAWSGTTFWEIIQPISGDNIYSDWLEQHGEGIQHVAQKCESMTFDEKIAEFKKRGFSVSHSGLFNNSIQFAYINTEDAVGCAFEILDFADGITMPEPEEWYPAPPPQKG